MEQGREAVMKKYNITVNGKKYEVEVEEVFSSPSAATQSAAAPVSSVRTPEPVKAKATADGGNTVIEAAVPGKVVKIAASAGSAVKKGDPVVVIESMKMEIPVVAPEDGTVTVIKTAVGENVETGDILAMMDV